MLAGATSCAGSARNWRSSHPDRHEFGSSDPKNRGAAIVRGGRMPSARDGSI